jgi:flagellar protein FlaG
MEFDPSIHGPLGVTPRTHAARIASEQHSGEHTTKRSEQTERETQPVKAQKVPDSIKIDNMQVRLKFSEDKETGIRVVQVLDADSGKVVRQIPPEEILNVTKALREIKGLLVSKES